MNKSNTLFKVLFFVLTAFLVLIIVGATVLIYVSTPTPMPADDQMALLIVGPTLLFVFLLLAVIGIIVFKDAKKIGMNPWMWLTIVIFAPNGLGIIIYLIVRYNEKKRLKCHECGKPVEADYAKCPYCGTQLKSTCPNCDKSVDGSWKVCPYCSHELN